MCVSEVKAVKQVLSDISCTSKDAMAHWWAERFLKTWEDNKADLGDDVGTLVLEALISVAEKSHSARLEWYDHKVWYRCLRCWMVVAVFARSPS